MTVKGKPENPRPAAPPMPATDTRSFARTRRSIATIRRGARRIASSSSWDIEA